MNIEDAYKYIKNTKPKVVYISGKTSVGKSTFANNIRNDFKYEIIELDSIVLNDIVPLGKPGDEGNVFVEVYRNRNKAEWVNRFVMSVKKKINELQLNGTNVIIEGALANPETINEVLDGVDGVMIYIHPQDIDVYIRNLTSRFLKSSAENNAGLPLTFWKKIPEVDFLAFQTTRQLSGAIELGIAEYAAESQSESRGRLETFKEHFSNLIVVKV